MYPNKARKVHPRDIVRMASSSAMVTRLIARNTIYPTEAVRAIESLQEDS